MDSPATGYQPGNHVEPSRNSTLSHISNRFQDSSHLEWEVKLTLQIAREIDNDSPLEKTGIDFSLVDPSEKFFKADIASVKIITHILWHCVKRQAIRNLKGDLAKAVEEAREFSQDPPTIQDVFFSRLEGSQLQQAIRATYKALIDFFPQGRTFLLAALEVRDYAQQQLDKATTELMAQKGKQEIDREIKRMVELLNGET